MLEFNDIYAMARSDRALPENAAPEEQMAYYELAGISAKFDRGIITKNTATKQKAAALERFNDVRKARLLNLEAYSAWQKNIKAGEEKLSELIKAIMPGADFEKLLKDALGIIALYEGVNPNVYAATAERKLKESA